MSRHAELALRCGLYCTVAQRNKISITLPNLCFMTSRSLRGISLLLATRTSIGLLLDGGNLAQHDDTVAVHERDARKTLAILEAVAHKRLLRLEAALSHLVGLERVRVFHLLASSPC